MKRFWRLGIMAFALTALLAPSASASLIGLEANITSITLIRNGRSLALTNDASSNIKGSGTASYTSPDLTGTETAPTLTSTGSGPAISYNGAFLQKINGSISGTTMSASLQGTTGPYGAPTNPGNITATVVDTAIYTGTWPTGNNGATSFAIPYTYTYSLDSGPGNSFYSVEYKVTAALYIGNVLIGNYTLLDYSLANANQSPLNNFGTVTGSGALGTGVTFKPIPNSGPQTFTVVLTETMTGYAVPIPASGLLLGSGLLGLGLVGWRRKRS